MKNIKILKIINNAFVKYQIVKIWNFSISYVAAENDDLIKFLEGFSQGMFMYQRGVFMYLRVCPRITTLPLPVIVGHGTRLILIEALISARSMPYPPEKSELPRPLRRTGWLLFIFPARLYYKVSIRRCFDEDEEGLDCYE